MELVRCDDGYELRGPGGVAGRVGPAGSSSARAEAGGAHWELTLHRDPTRVDGSWQVFALDEAGDEAAAYFHGGMRGGRVRAADGAAGTLRRGLGLGADWRVRLADCALTLRPTEREEGLALHYVAGSVEPPALLLLLVCWAVMSEAQMEPPPLS